MIKGTLLDGRSRRLRDEGSDWIDRDCRRRYEGRAFISFSCMLAKKINEPKRLFMIRKSEVLYVTVYLHFGLGGCYGNI